MKKIEKELDELIKIYLDNKENKEDKEKISHILQILLTNIQKEYNQISEKDEKIQQDLLAKNIKEDDYQKLKEELETTITKNYTYLQDFIQKYGEIISKILNNAENNSITQILNFYQKSLANLKLNYAQRLKEIEKTLVEVTKQEWTKYKKANY